MPDMPGFIFDLDGTLADTMPCHFEAWQLIAGRYGLRFPETRFYELGGVPTPKIAKMLIDEAALDLDAELVAREKEDVVAQVLLSGSIRPIAPVVEIARRSRDEGPLAIGSGSPRALVERTLSALGIAHWFQAVVCAEDTERHKPHPDVFLEAARRIRIAPASCTVYEDTDLGLEAARRAGMKPVDVRVVRRAHERRLDA
jgi:HAD superfamily hydrolase (TIGR01509 family)